MQGQKPVVWSKVRRSPPSISFLNQNNSSALRRNHRRTKPAATSSNIASNTSSNTKIQSRDFSSNMSTNSCQHFPVLQRSSQYTLKKKSSSKNRYKNKGIYATHRHTIQNLATASTFPPLEWRESCSLKGNGNEKVPDPKSQLDTSCCADLKTSSKYPR